MSWFAATEEALAHAIALHLASCLGVSNVSAGTKNLLSAPPPSSSSTTNTNQSSNSSVSAVAVQASYAALEHCLKDLAQASLSIGQSVQEIRDRRAAKEHLKHSSSSESVANAPNAPCNELQRVGECRYVVAVPLRLAGWLLSRDIALNTQDIRHDLMPPSDLSSNGTSLVNCFSVLQTDIRRLASSSHPLQISPHRNTTVAKAAMRCLGYLIHIIGAIEVCLDVDAVGDFPMVLLEAIASVMARADREQCYLGVWSFDHAGKLRQLCRRTDSGANEVWLGITALCRALEQKEESWHYSATLEATAIHALSTVLAVEPDFLTRPQNAAVWLPPVLERCRSSTVKVSVHVGMVARQIMLEHVDRVLNHSLGIGCIDACSKIAEEHLLPFIADRVMSNASLLEILSSERLAAVNHRGDLLSTVASRLQVEETTGALYVWSFAFRIIGQGGKRTRLMNLFLDTAVNAFRYGVSPDVGESFLRKLVSRAFTGLSESSNDDVFRRAMEDFRQILRTIATVRATTFEICWQAVFRAFVATRLIYSTKRLALLLQPYSVISDEFCDYVGGSAAASCWNVDEKSLIVLRKEVGEQLSDCDFVVHTAAVRSFRNLCLELAALRETLDAPTLLASSFKPIVRERLDVFIDLVFKRERRRAAELVPIICELVRQIACEFRENMEPNEFSSSNASYFIGALERLLCVALREGIDTGPTSHFDALWKTIIIGCIEQKTRDNLDTRPILQLLDELPRTLEEQGITEGVDGLVENLLSSLQCALLSVAPHKRAAILACPFESPNSVARSTGAMLIEIAIHNAPASTGNMVELMCERLGDTINFSPDSLLRPVIREIADMFLKSLGDLASNEPTLTKLNRTRAVFGSCTVLLSQISRRLLKTTPAPPLPSLHNAMPGLDTLCDQGESFGIPKEIEDAIVLPLVLYNQALHVFTGEDRGQFAECFENALQQFRPTLFSFLRQLRKFQRQILQAVGALEDRRWRVIELLNLVLICRRLATLLPDCRDFDLVLGPYIILSANILSVTMETAFCKDEVESCSAVDECLAQLVSSLTLTSNVPQPNASAGTLSTIVDRCDIFLSDDIAFEAFGLWCELLHRLMTACVSCQFSAPSSVPLRYAWLQAVQHVLRTIQFVPCALALCPLRATSDCHYTIPELLVICLKTLNGSKDNGGCALLIRNPIPFSLQSESPGPHNREGFHSEVSESSRLVANADAVRDLVLAVFSLFCEASVGHLHIPDGHSASENKDPSSLARGIITEFAPYIAAGLESTMRTLQAEAKRFVTDQCIIDRYGKSMPMILRKPIRDLRARGELGGTKISPTARALQLDQAPFETGPVPAKGIEAPVNISRKRPVELSRQNSTDYVTPVPRSELGKNTAKTPRQEEKRLKLDPASYIPPTRTTADPSQAETNGTQFEMGEAAHSTHSVHSVLSLRGAATLERSAEIPNGNVKNFAIPTTLVTPSSARRPFPVDRALDSPLMRPLLNSLGHAVEQNYDGIAVEQLRRAARLCNILQGKLLDAMVAVNRGKE